MVRPNWDETWMTMAKTLAERSHDDRFRVGALVVTRENTRVLSLGYNGNFPGGPHERESDEPGKSGFIHAEVNCLVKMDFNDPAEKVMYVTLSPCAMCAKLILAARVKEVVYCEEYRDLSGIRLLNQNGVKVRQYPVPAAVAEVLTAPIPTYADVMPCSLCKRPCKKGDRLAKGGKVWCDYDCAEEDGEDWAQK